MLYVGTKQKKRSKEFYALRLFLLSIMQNEERRLHCEEQFSLYFPSDKEKQQNE